MSRKPTSRKKEPWYEAVNHLRGLGAFWPEVIDRVGPCRLTPMPDRFGTLVRAIISQQISSKAAASIEARVRAAAGEPHEPAGLLRLGETGLRSSGVSGPKARYILNLSEAVAEGRVPFREFDGWDDDAIVSCLTTVKGIGVWTAEMFLIFVLNRPDVLPVHDLGVRVAIRDRFGLPELPKPAECRTLAEAWRPYRSIASWYIWRDADARTARKG
jgi:3-methyladenine DNA glycosylase/8-oxoguanine DNA glycosylase